MIRSGLSLGMPGIDGGDMDLAKSTTSCSVFLKSYGVRYNQNAICYRCFSVYELTKDVRICWKRLEDVILFLMYRNISQRSFPATDLIIRSGTHEDKIEVIRRSPNAHSKQEQVSFQP